MARWTRLWPLAVALTAVVVLSVFPGIDLAASALFFDGESFRWNGHPVAERIDEVVQAIGVGLLVVLPVMWVVGSRLGGRLAQPARNALFVWLVLTLGAVVIANWTLKDGWGRARPVQIEQFGGTRSFTPALLPATECGRNCSFVCGHATIGFLLCALGLVKTPRRAVYQAAGVVMGTLIGLNRIMQGEHFLSDVAGSLLVVYGTAMLLRALLPWWTIGEPRPLQPATAAADAPDPSIPPETSKIERV